MHDIREIGWDEILPVWSNRLWPNRTTVIEPTSSMKYLGGYDKKLKENTPYFIGAWHENHLIGVNSIVGTGSGTARSRGIWVDPEHRKSGVGIRIMQACVDIIRLKEGNGITKIWSAPRQSALGFYIRCGFTQTSDFTDDGFEFGPNCYVLMDLEKQHA